MLPPAMLPHVLPGHRSPESFELAGICGDDRVHVGVEHAGAGHLHRLEGELETSVRHSGDTAKQNRGVQTECEDGRTTWRLGKSAEEGHPGGREACCRLIDKKSHSAALADDT